MLSRGFTHCNDCSANEILEQVSLFRLPLHSAIGVFMDGQRIASRSGNSQGVVKRAKAAVAMARMQVSAQARFPLHFVESTH